MFMKRKYIIIYLLASFCFLIPVGVNAEEPNNEEFGTEEITPYYWPGNPNPIPGSEAWLHENGTKIPTGPKARQCANKVLGSGWTYAGGAAGLIGTTLSIAAFAKSFGITAAMSWLQCVHG